ncbi:MAG: hypothetical protein JO256_07530 [Alphaproteobacteria bacterium]|nr:hypothetical protein [Alphaproteobacteria bacterium]
MAINDTDGAFQACYWRDPARISEDADAAEYSDYAMELKQRIHTLFRERRYAYAAIFRWDEAAQDWALLEEFALRGGAPTGA